MSTLSHVLLTGGTGFFGRALLRSWLSKSAAGIEVPLVTVLSRSPATMLAAHPEFSGLRWLEFRKADVCVAETLPTCGNYSHVLHAATESTLGPQLTPMQRYDQIVAGTRNMLDVAVRCSATRFLLTSSGGVYGSQPNAMERIPEDFCGIPDPLVPGSAYGIAKRTAEHLCSLYGQAHELSFVVARCFAFIGEDLPLNTHFAIGNFIRDALVAEAITVAGDGTPLRSYLDQRDLANWLMVLLERGGPGRAYNVGSDEAISIGDLAHLVRDTLAPAKAVRVLGSPDVAVGRNRYVPDIARAQSELGLCVRIPLRQAIQDTAAAILLARKGHHRV